MTKKEKLVDKFLENPSSLKYSQLVYVLEYYGFIQIQAKGSHVKFKHPKLNKDLTIPLHNKECKNFYKQLAKKFVEGL
ncbi:type II toxin-antitoxin system HicA family toxin [Candidatus Kaiserbacteria bacterium]|nr:type II toxin-antitoxin system HicA family toxin [Candidatus Kaiserbacteria bacterium]